MIDFYEILLKEKQRSALAICTVINTKGSTPRSIGAKMIVFPNGRIIGTIGGGNLEKGVIKDAQEVIRKKKPQFFRHDLLHQHNMCCGGTIDIFIDPIMPKNKLYVFGAGHTGRRLAKYAVDFDFEVFLLDNRDEELNKLCCDGVNKMPVSFAKVLTSLPFTGSEFVCIMTYDHAIDRQILEYCINKPFAYLGMIGSKRKIELTRKKFIEANVCTNEQLDMVDMPIGTEDVGDDPQGIALGVMVKMIQTKNRMLNE